MREEKPKGKIKGKKKICISICDKIKKLGNMFMYNRIFGMNFLGPLEEERKIVTNVFTCREYMIGIVREALHGTVDRHVQTSYWAVGMYPKFDMNKVRLLISNTAVDAGSQGAEDWKHRLFIGKKLLNFYESVAGWTHSTITSVDVEGNPKGIYYLLTAPGIWFRSPFYLSLMVLILRAPTYYNSDFDFKSDIIEEQEAEVNKYWEGYIAYFEKVYSSSDVEHIKKYELFIPLMKEWKTFIPADIKMAYPIDGRNDISGISSLCLKTSFSDEANRKMGLLINKHNAAKGKDAE